MNDSDQMVGGQAVSYGVMYTGGNPVLCSQDGSMLRGINSSGQAAGQWVLDIAFWPAFPSQDEIEVLPVPSQFSGWHVFALNDHEQMVGGGYGGTAGDTAVLWGRNPDTGAWTPSYLGGGKAVDINNAGVAVGYGPSSDDHAKILADGVWRDLVPTAPQPGLPDQREWHGRRHGLHREPRRATRLHLASGETKLTDLGVLGGKYVHAQAWGVNDRSPVQVVGYAPRGSSSLDFRACLWEWNGGKSTIYDLNTLANFPANETWVLTMANAVDGKREHRCGRVAQRLRHLDIIWVRLEPVL